MNSLHTPLRRRHFLSGGAALGLTTLIPMSLLSACGGGSDPDDAKPGALRETRTLNFDLTHAPIALPRLQLLNSAHHGRPLSKHTTATRAAQRAANPALASIPDANLTHYLENVDVPALALQSGAVMGKHTRTGADVLALQFLHVPTSSIAAVAAKRLQSPLVDRQPASLRGVVAAATPLPLPTVIGQYSPPRDIAVSLIFMHPAITNLDANLGGDIVDRINSLPNATQPYLATLMYQIAQLIEAGGWPSTTDTGSWCYLVGRTDASGNPVLDSSGNPLYSLTINDALSDTVGTTVKQILNNINNDATFSGTNWQPSNGAPQQTGVALAVAAAYAKPDRRMLASVGDPSAFTVQHSLSLGSRTSGIRFKSIESSNDRSVQITVANEFLRTAGVFVQYRDAAGNPLPVDDPSDMDTSRAKYLCLLSPDIQIMGIPFLGSTTPTTIISFTMPDAAAEATIFYGGLGLGGTDAFQGEAILGTISTMVLNIGLPSICLAAGVGELAYKGLQVVLLEALLDTSIASAIIKGVFEALGSGLASSIQTASTTKSLTAALGGIADTALDIFFGIAPQLSVKLAGAIGSATAADALPIIGQALWALSALVDAAMIAETVVECLSCAAIDSATVSLSMDQTVRISRDPGDYQFPATATKVRVVATHDGAKASGIVEAVVTKGMTGPLDVDLGSVASGGNVSIEATFYDDADTIVGYGQSGSLANLPASAALVPITITEVLVPLTASTVYDHSTRLVLNGSVHAWDATVGAPTATVTSLQPGVDGVLGALHGITVHTPTGMAGYAFAGGGQGIGLCGGGSAASLSSLRNVFLGDNPDSAAKFSTCGASQPMGICYDANGSKTSGGNDFFLQPGADGFYHLRSTTLDATDFDMAQPLSWGRFSNPQDSLCVLSNGFVIGCNRDTHKMEVLKLPQSPDTPRDESDSVPFSALKSGFGSLAGLLDTPVAVAAIDDNVLVLEQGNQRVQAFDQDGSAIALFTDANGVAFNSPILTLKNDGATVTYLDIAVEGKGYVYVLSYTDDGSAPADYHLDVYTPAGAWLCRTPGMAAGAIAVDLFRNITSLNYEPIAGATQVQPSLSQWLPHGAVAMTRRAQAGKVGA